MMLAPTLHGGVLGFDGDNFSCGEVAQLFNFLFRWLNWFGILVLIGVTTFSVLFTAT